MFVLERVSAFRFQAPSFTPLLKLPPDHSSSSDLYHPDLYPAGEEAVALPHNPYPTILNQQPGARSRCSRGTEEAHPDSKHQHSLHS